MDSDIKPNVSSANDTLLSKRLPKLSTDSYKNTPSSTSLTHPKLEKLPKCSSPILESAPDVDDVIDNEANIPSSPADTVIISDAFDTSPIKVDYQLANDSFFEKIPSNISILHCDSVEDFLKLNDSSHHAMSYSSFIDQTGISFIEERNAEPQILYIKSNDPSVKDISRQDTVILPTESCPSGGKSVSLTPSLLRLISSVCRNADFTSDEMIQSNENIDLDIRSEVPRPSQTTSNETSLRESVLERLRKRCIDSGVANATTESTPSEPKQAKFSQALDEDRLSQDDDDEEEDEKNDDVKMMSFRERNRIAAKKARSKKKRYVEELERENGILQKKLSKWKVQMQSLKKENQQSRDFISQLLKIFNTGGLAGTQCQHCGMSLLLDAAANSANVRGSNYEEEDVRDQESTISSANLISSPVNVNKRVQAWGRLFLKGSSTSSGSCHGTNVKAFQQPIQLPTSTTANQPKFVIIRPAPPCQIQPPENTALSDSTPHTHVISSRPNIPLSKNLRFHTFRPSNPS